MVEERVIQCPFCKKMTVKILHQPFVSTQSMSRSRAGKGGSMYTKERTEVLSGCGECGKSLEEIEKHLNDVHEITPEEHKKRLDRLKAMGLPTRIVSTRN
jgi:hypothetical protein